MQRGLPFVEESSRNLCYAFRQLRRSPGFALTAILTLALGLGANTTIFSLFNGLLLRPLPVPHSDDLALIHFGRSEIESRYGYSFCAPLLRALEKRHEAFESVAGFTGRPLQVRGNSGNVEIEGALVSGQFFQVLETAPLMGRYLTPQDDRPGGGSTEFGVVIGEGFWRRWFGGAPDVVGRRLTIANTSFTVVGVMPKRFIGADPTQRPDIYVPLWAEPIVDAPYNNMLSGYHSWWLRIVGRRNAGVTLEQANTALLAASNPILDEAIPDAKWIQDARDHHFRFNAEPGSAGYSDLRSEFHKPLVAVFALCAAMLLLACLNLASLLMARAAARQREVATKLALGATRLRLVGQLLTESLLIAVLGTATGMVAVPVVSRLLTAVVLGNNRNAILDTSLDWRVFLYVALVAVAATVLIGLIPALRATSGNLNSRVNNGAHATTAREKRSLLPRALLGLEVALALMLVTGAGLLTASLSRLYRTGLGFDPKGLVNLDLDMGKQSLDGDALARWYKAFADALKHQPGVTNVSFAGVKPLTGSNWAEEVHTPLSNGTREIHFTPVAPEYFATMRIPMLEGQDFSWSDTSAQTRKIVLNRSAAKILFPGKNPIGQHLIQDFGNTSYEVVGLVGDTKYESIRREVPAGGYISITQSDRKKPSYTAVVRMQGSAVPLADAARSLAAKMAPDIPAPVMTTMASDLDASIASERMMAMLAVFFAGCALLVTAIGLYGTLAYATARRTSEIGLRMALGAQRTQVVTMIFRENLWIATAGSAAGLGAAWLASRALASFLYEISARDPWVMLGSVTALVSIASAASLVPALRAARIEPMEALRTE